MKRLLDIGFIKAGNWFLEKDKINYNIELINDEKNILYCFVINFRVKYIGKTIKKLSQRMYGYKNPVQSQRTNFRIHPLIQKSLKEKNEVDIYILKDEVLFKLGKFKVNVAAGLEDTLIAEINPDWNYIGKKKKNLEKKKKSYMIDEFIVNIGFAYYNSGFFNVRKKYSEKFGEHRTPIKVQLGEEKSIIEGYVNRTANTNKTPRIMLGKSYTNWMKENFKEGDVMKVKIINSNTLILTR